MLRVSLIMTCYNCIDAFKVSVESALAQDYPDLELVVVDGGSTDGTVEVIRTYADRIASQNTTSAKATGIADSAAAGPVLQRTMQWVSEPDRGIYDGMNKGIHMATGDVIAVFNDTFTRTDAISMLVAALEREQADGVHSDLVYCDGDVCKRLWQMGDGGMKVAADGHVRYPGIHTGWMPAHPTLYLRRAVYERFGDYDIAMKSSSDYDYMLRILTGQDAIRLAYVPEVLLSMFWGGTSNGGGGSGYWRNIQEAYAALRHNHVHFPLVAIGTRVIRTLGQYRGAARYNA